MRENKAVKKLEIINYEPLPSEHSILLEKAAKLLDEFCEKEYDSDGADYSDLTAVNIAYTTTEDELHEIQADVNLVDLNSAIWFMSATNSSHHSTKARTTFPVRSRRRR